MGHKTKHLFLFLFLLVSLLNSFSLCAQSKAEKIIYSVEMVEGDLDSWDIWMMDPDGSSREPLVDDPGTNGDPSVSRDGRFIKYNDFVSESTVLKDLVTGEKWSFAWADGYTFDWSTWLPDDSAAVGWTHFSPNAKCGLNLATISKNGEFGILLDRDAYLYPIGTSPGTNYLYFLEGSCTPTGSYFNIGDIRSLDLTNGKTSLIIPSSGKQVFRGDVNEGGTLLVYAEEGQILLADLAGSSVETLTDGKSYAYSPSFSLDGLDIVFVEVEAFGKNDIIKLSLSGGNRTVINVDRNLDLLHWGYVITSSPPVFRYFGVDKAIVYVDEDFEISWEVDDASGCQASGSWEGEKSTLGSELRSISQPGLYDFSLDCINLLGETGFSTVSIEVRIPEVVDADGDGYYSDVDCNDSNPWVHPGLTHDFCSRDGTAGEVAGLDFDCDGTFENGADSEKPEPNGAFHADLEAMIYTKGFIYRDYANPSEKSYDYCLDSTNVVELYCCVPGADSIACGVIYTCPGQCVDGACVLAEPVQISSFVADPVEINKGHTTTLSWSVSNADNCVASGGAGGWAGSILSPDSGEKTVTLTEAGTYNFLLECSNSTSNDTASATVTVVDNTQPDLMVTGISTDKVSLNSGDVLQISVTISNAGDAAAEASYLSFYLSTNQSITNLDQRLATSSSPALEPGESYSTSREPVVTAETGVYWVGVCVNNISNEVDYENNCQAGPQITIEESIEICSTQVIHCEESQSGNLDAEDCASGPLGPGHYAEQFSFSGVKGDTLFLEAFWSFDGYLLIEDTNGLIVAENDNFTGASDSRIEYKLPQDGTYTIWTSSFTPETSGAFEVLLSCQGPTGPDLSVDSLLVDDGPLLPGQSLQVSVKLNNLGTSATDSTTLHYLLSSDSVIDLTDAELVADGAPALDAGESSVQTISLVAPVTPGNFRIGVCADPVSGESSVSNNCSEAALVTIAERPACTIRSLSCGASGTGELSINDCTSGPRGPGYLAEAFEIEAGAGRELVFKADWQNLDGFLVLADPSGRTVALNDDFGGPLKSRIEFKTERSGVHRLWATSYARNAEGTYGVEMACGADSAPDLQASKATADTSVLLPSETIGVEAIVRNAGNLSSEQTQVSFMLSYDPQISPQDERIATMDLASLSAGESRLVQEVLSAPESAGNYWVGVCVEPVDSEILTTNNCSYITEDTSPSTLQRTGKRKTRPRPQASFGEGTPIQVSNGNECQQTAISCGQMLSGTLSTQTDCDRSPRGMGYVSDLYTFDGQAGDTVSVTANWAGLDGYLYLADAAGNVIGQNDDFLSDAQSRFEHVLEATGPYEIWPVAFDKNGQGSYDLKLSCNTPMAPDLVMNVPEISEQSVRRGQNVTVSARVENSGNGVAQASSVRFVLSTSPTLLSHIKVLGTTDLAPLESAESSNESLSVPVNVTPGTYYVGSCVNADSTELDTVNNCNVSTAFSVEDTFDPIPITKGLNDAWYNDDTSGQGFFITVFPNNKLMSLAWFTFDTERPPSNVTAQVGEPGHRWLTALGTYERGVANLDVFLSEGGVFDAGDPPVITEEPDPPFGTMKVRFMDCIHGEIEFDLPSIGQSGTIPIKRIVFDNVASCNDQVGELSDQAISTLTNSNVIDAEISKTDTQAEVPQANTFNYNPSLNDAWFNPETNGQGFFFNVYPNVGLVFLSWFTFDVTRPPVNTPYVLGEPGHRWLNALGYFDGNKAELGVYNTSGGVFNSGRLNEDDEVNIGTILASFEDCNSGVIKYDIDPVGQGEVPIRRIAYDTIPDCEQKSRGDESSAVAVTPENKTLMANLCNGKVDWQFDWPDIEQASYYYFQLKRADSPPDDSPIQGDYLFETVSKSDFRYQKNTAVGADHLNGWTWRYIPKFTGPGVGESVWSEFFTFDVKPVTDPCLD